MRLLYTTGIYLYTLAIRTAALFGHRKARQMCKGWGEWERRTEKIRTREKVAWFHASSLGEFEQARPLIEAFRERNGEYAVVLTFFSPSGYEVRKDYAGVDAVCYLPPDTPRRVSRFLQQIHPERAFFAKYDFWYNYLDALRKRGTKTYLFSAIFRPEQYFFRPWGKWFARQLRNCFAHLFVQNEESVRLLKERGIERCSTAGDTRFDRVHQIATQSEGEEGCAKFAAESGSGQLIVCGSTWPPDERLIAATCPTEKYRLIIAPHEINEEHLQHIEQLFPQSIRHSRMSSYGGERVLIVDNIGMLSRIYRYADIAYIGGGFGAGIHNILEAATYGKPVLFGPKHQKFQEAKDILAAGGGFSHRNEEELRGSLQRLSDAEELRKASEACRGFMQRNLGSTQKILSLI